MGSTTPGVALRYAYDGDVITHATVANLADDIASKLDLADTARSSALKRPVWYGRRVLTPLNVPVTTVTVVPMDQEIIDTHNMIDVAGANPSRITVNSTSGAGVYELSLMARVTTTSWSKGEWIIRKNGATIMQQTIYLPRSVSHAVSVQVPMIVGDYLEGALYHEGGGTTTSQNIELRGHKVSA